MKKIYIRLSAFFIALIVSFFSFPFFNVCALSSIPSWLSSENIQYFLATQSGLVSSSNDSLQSFFEDPSFETFSDAVNNAVVFVPGMGIFRLGIPDVQLEGFSKDDCDIVVNDDDTVTFKDDFVHSIVGSFGTDIDSPLDGVEVITNFNYNGDFSSLGIPSYSETLIDNIKNDFISRFGDVYLFSGLQTYINKPYQYMYRFYSFPNSDFVYFIEKKNSSNEISIFYKFHDVSSNSWNGGYDCSCVYLPFGSGITSKDYLRYPNSSSTWLNVISGFPYVSSDNTNIQINNNLTYSFYQNIIPDYWSNNPLVLASNDSAGQNYYYWLKGSPSGVYYNFSNMQETYNTSYVNNNWEQTYNNYVTDVSNYYSTTENITNENLSQYIDNSTTITNITNNYITNNNGGGSGEDDVITNSWLERIYNKLLDIISILRGQSLSDSTDTYVTDNSIKNDIVEYPLSDLFPSVPDENFLSDNVDFSFPVASDKVSSALFNTIPFCYLEQVKIIVGALSVPPSAPYYEIPFVIESANINESVVIDLTSDTWSNIHSVWIVLFMICFIVALIYFTYRFILLVSTIIG